MKRSGALPSENTKTPILNRLFSESITGMNLCLQLQLISSFAMFGIVWLVQLVVYPLFATIGSDAWLAFEKAYTTRAGWVIGPLMGIELTTAVLLFIRKPKLRLWFALNLALVTATWISTFVIQVPLHESLAGQWNTEQWHRLVGTNWIRTALWSAKVPLLIWAAHGVCKHKTVPKTNPSQ